MKIYTNSDRSELRLDRGGSSYYLSEITSTYEQIIYHPSKYEYLFSDGPLISREIFKIINSKVIVI